MKMTNQYFFLSCFISIALYFSKVTSFAHTSKNKILKPVKDYGEKINRNK